MANASRSIGLRKRKTDMDRKDALSLIRKYKGNWMNEIQEAIETLIPELPRARMNNSRN